VLSNFAVYVDDLIVSLRQSGYGLFVGQVFVRYLLYADAIVLLSPSCFGLRKLVSMCENFGAEWNITFNPLKSQLATLNDLEWPFCIKFCFALVCLEL